MAEKLKIKQRPNTSMQFDLPQNKQALHGSTTTTVNILIVSLMRFTLMCKSDENKANCCENSDIKIRCRSDSI